MTHYKGVQLSDELAGLVRYMDEVDEHREALQMLQAAWDNLAMLGELSGMGVQIGGVRAAFGELTGRLLNHLGEQARRKAALALQAKAQVAVDILVRNLFERTADIGFLATDHNLREYAEADADQRLAGRSALIERLREYQRKYSVYADVVLLAPDGGVLARFDDRITATHTSDPLLREALASSDPYLERYGHSDLRPGAEPALIYACRVMSADGRKPVAVLCLCFDFADECRRIFDGLSGEDDWGVLALLDAQGVAIASSDTLQVPLGARVSGAVGAGSAGADLAAGAQALRFGGRRWLGVSCEAQAYQGYAGPGWRGHAMVPLEHAFEQEEDSARQDTPLQRLPAPQRAALMTSPQLFSEALRDIAPSAERIESELKRTVWNGNVALGAQAAGRDAQFSRTLLREIGRTGARSREVFAHAIANVNETVVSAMLEDSRSRAALAIDIMDRNLYERANDCRWWALTALFREALAAPEVDAAMQAALTRVLQTIHGLYTVYDNLVLFDRNGCVVAVSRAGEHAAVGQTLGAPWVRDCLALPDTQSYCVSPYEPTPLYADRLTCIYAAAVRAPEDARRVVGGIAIVFDGQPQFDAMLADTLPSASAFSAFVEPGGRVIACSRADIAPGSHLPATLLPSPSGATGPAADAGVVVFEQQLYALGTCRSTGYREFKDHRDAYQHEAIAMVFVPLAECPAESSGKASASATLAMPALSAPLGHEQQGVDLASFAVGGEWYGVPCDAVVEAVVVRQITPLTRGDGRVSGTVLHRGQAIAVFDLGALLQGTASATGPGGTVIVMRASGGRPPFGLLVEALGDHLQVPASRLERLDKLYPQGHPFIESLVRTGPSHAGGMLLMVLSAERLSSELMRARQWSDALA